jgi:DNA-binding response OmpR family regulator
MTTLLVVDDQSSMRLLVRTALETVGYQVLEAPDGRHGLQMARLYHPDLVLLDVVLPDMSGVAVCRVLRDDTALSRTPVIMLSAMGELSDRDDARDAGADRYLTKPFSPSDLARAVRSLVGP